MKNIEKAALLEYSDLVLDGKEQEEIIYNCYDGKCTYNGKTLNVKGDMPDRGRIIVNEDGVTFENIIIKGYNCIKENNKFTCNNAGLITVNGTNILIDNNKTTEIENYRIYGNSIQNGTPTPEKPVEVESVGDLITLDNCLNYGSDACNNVGKYVIPIKVTGKNLFDISKINSFKKADYEMDATENNSIDNGIITSNVGAYGATVLLYDSKMFLNEGVYTIQANFMADKESGNKVVTLGLRDIINGINYRNFPTLSDYKIWEREIYKITIPTSSNFAVNTQGGGEQGDYGNLNIKIKDIQLEYGDKATEYEPYKETITNIYLDSPLRSIGEYADYIDFRNKKVIRMIKNIKFNGNEKWYKYPNKDYSYYIESLDAIQKYYLLISNYFQTDISCLDIRPAIRFINNTPSRRMYIFDNSDNTLFASLDGLSSWLQEKYLSGNPLSVDYVLETPIEEKIDLPKLSINKDTSIISVNTTVKSSKLEIQYYK